MASKKILVQEDFVHVSSGSNPAAGFLAFYPKSDNNFYLRTSAGVERRIWDSGNHGPGSGLNADLLDGLHASSFAPVVHSPHGTLILAGARSKIYRIGDYRFGDGSSSSGEIVMVADSGAQYGDPSVIKWYVSRLGSFTEEVFGRVMSTTKALSVYKIAGDTLSQDQYFIYLHVPNYNDGWKIFEEYAKNINYDILDVTESWDAEIAGKTLISTTLGRTYLGTGYYNSGKIGARTFESTQPTGTAPFVIASTTVNTNLNADLLDGQHASAFAPTSHNHSFAGLTDVALVSPSAGHTLVYNGTAWVNNSQIRSMPGSEYNTIYIRSSESVGDFGDSEIYMTAEEGIYFRTNIGKSTAAEASFDRYGIRSSKLMGTGERYLATASDGLIKVATVQPTQYWHRDAGNFNVSPVNPADEVHAWLFKAGAGGILMADGYLETNRAGIYTSYNDMVVSEFYLLNNTFYYANSKLAFNNSTNLLTVDGGINAGSNLIAAGEVKLTKQTPGGVLRLQSHNAGPKFLRQYDYAGGVIFEVYNGSGYGGPAGIMARASEDHSASGYGTDIEIWNTANGGTNNRPVAIIRQDGIFKSGYGFAVGGDDGRSGTATIVTGCSYNSGTKTLIYTRASVTFSGGIVTSIASMSSLSVPLT